LTLFVQCKNGVNLPFDKLRIASARRRLSPCQGQAINYKGQLPLLIVATMVLLFFGLSFAVSE
jgi:hypothetical protein